METPRQKCVRLLGALEDLAGQEAAALTRRDFACLLHAQERAAPLVRHLAEHGPAVADASLRSRVATWLARRNERDGVLAVEIDRAKAELNQLDVSERRIKSVAPAYGLGMTAPSRLNAVG